jgi:hypothetical protein
MRNSFIDIANLPRGIASVIGSIFSPVRTDIESASPDASVSEDTSEHRSLAVDGIFSNDIVSALPDVEASSSEEDGTIEQHHVTPLQPVSSVQVERIRSLRIVQAPTDIYTSVNIPEIETLITFDEKEMSYQKSISITAPLSFRNQLSDAQKQFQNLVISPAPNGMAESGSIIYDSVTNREILYKRSSGWFASHTYDQIYDNKGNKATDDIDFQISRIRKCGEVDKFQVKFTDWEALDPLDMYLNELTGNGSNKYMVKFLSHMRNYIAVGKWQSLGGKKKQRPRNIALQTSTQQILKTIATENDRACSEALSKYEKPDEPLMITTVTTGCLIASVINALRLNSWEQFSDALDSIMSVEMLARYCNDKFICVLERIKERPIAVDYLMRRCVEIEVTTGTNLRESELYILFDSNICHCISIDLKRKVVYDSASDNKQPYMFSEEVLSLLGFTRTNAHLELRKMINIGRQFNTIPFKRKICSSGL